MYISVTHPLTSIAKMQELYVLQQFNTVNKNCVMDESCSKLLYCQSVVINIELCTYCSKEEHNINGGCMHACVRARACVCVLHA